jgi:hypothetical protein
MKQLSRSRKPASTLSESVTQQLNMYALAAKASEVSALALLQTSGPKILTYALAASVVGLGAFVSAPSAEAKIVYTKVHVYLPVGYYSPEYVLDLNHDGRSDFVFRGRGTCDSGCTFDVGIYGYVGGNENQIIGTKHQARFRPNAVALRTGARIGPARHFYNSGEIASAVTNSKGIFWYGQWGDGGKGLKNRYLGLQFVIKGKIHYGWARVSVKTTSGEGDFTAILTGYAYETIPNKPIIAGNTKGSEAGTVLPSSATHRTPKSKPSTLGELALGR